VEVHDGSKKVTKENSEQDEMEYGHTFVHSHLHLHAHTHTHLHTVRRKPSPKRDRRQAAPPLLPSGRRLMVETSRKITEKTETIEERKRGTNVVAGRSKTVGVPRGPVRQLPSVTVVQQQQQQQQEPIDSFGSSDRVSRTTDQRPPRL